MDHPSTGTSGGGAPRIEFVPAVGVSHGGRLATGDRGPPSAAEQRAAEAHRLAAGADRRWRETAAELAETKGQLEDVRSRLAEEESKVGARKSRQR